MGDMSSDEDTEDLAARAGWRKDVPSYGKFERSFRTMRSSSSSVSFQPVAFVSSGLNDTKAKPTEEREGDERGSDDQQTEDDFVQEQLEDEERARKFRKLMSGSALSTSTTSASHEVKKKDLDPKRENELRQVSGRNGFALNLLKKFGFSGRLGKSEDGISMPIQVAARRNANSGIGAEGEEEITKLNEEVNVELFGTEEEKRRLRLRKEREREEAREEEELRELWKKAKAKGAQAKQKQPKKKNKYKTAAELLREKEAQSSGNGLVVIDMRGGEARFISSGATTQLLKPGESSSIDYSNKDKRVRTRARSDSSTSSRSSSSSSSSSSTTSTSTSSSSKASLARDKKPSIGEELGYNLGSLVQSAEAEATRLNFDVKRLSRVMEQEQTSLAELERDCEQLSGEIEELSETILAIEKAYAISKDQEVQLKVAWVECLQLLSSIWDGLPGIHVFQYDEDLAAVEVVSTLLHRFGVEQGYSFDVQNPNFAGLDEMLAKWVPFLGNQVNLKQAEIDHLLVDSVCLTLERSVRSAWQQVEQELLHADESDLEGFQSIKAKRVQVDAFCLTFFKLMGRYMSSGAVAATIKTSVIPELERRIEEFDVALDGPVLDSWIMPWADILRKHIRSKLHRKLRQKLTKSLERRCKRGKDLLEIGPRLVQPWGGLFSQATFRRLVMEGVVPRLQGVLKELRIDPVQQDIIPVQCVLAFQGILPEQVFFSLFEAHFFPKWLAALAKWLSGTEEKQHQSVVAEATKWFSGWIDLLAPLIEARDGRTMSYFGRALGFLASKAGAQTSLGVVPRKAHLENLLEFAEEMECQKSFEMYLEDRQLAFESVDSSMNTEVDSGKISTGKHLAHPEDLSPQEFLELVSGRLGITFMRDPKGKSNQHGKPIYVLGESTFVVVDAEICQVARLEPGQTSIEKASWYPIALEDLLRDWL